MDIDSKGAKGPRLWKNGARVNPQSHQLHLVTDSANRPNSRSEHKQMSVALTFVGGRVERSHIE